MTDYDCETIQRLALHNEVRGNGYLRALLVCIVLFVLIALFSTSHAIEPEPYLVVGFGKARLIEDQTDNLWHQTGFQHMAAEKSNTWRLGFGLRLNRYLAAELDYRDLGQFNSQALFTGDLGNPGSYNPATRQCNGPCNKSLSSWQHGETDGLGLSLIAAPDWAVAPFVRLGILYHRSTFLSSQVSAETPYQKQLSVFHANGEGGMEGFENKGWGKMLGAGVRAGSFAVEYTMYPKVAGPISPYRDISTITLSLRVDL